VDRFPRPLIVLQVVEDGVVPRNQSEMIVDALRACGTPVAYLLFEGEHHGFRRAESIRRALDSELSFYVRVLGFDLPAEEGNRADGGGEPHAVVCPRHQRPVRSHLAAERAVRTTGSTVCRLRSA
jgi:hypothetical protein